MIAHLTRALLVSRPERQTGEVDTSIAKTGSGIDALFHTLQGSPRLAAAHRRIDPAISMARRDMRNGGASFYLPGHSRAATHKFHHAWETSRVIVRLRLAGIAIGAAAAATLVTPAMAETKPSTRLVSCGTDSCLLVTGHRQSADAEVRINGHPVVVQGERSWRVRLPVSTVREWSAPFARKIEVSSYNPDMSATASHSAKLPIGLLGHVPDLASLVITLN